LAGGILNNGNLTLDHVVVRDNTMTTDAGDFWKGGAGIYNGEGATLTLVASTVSNNNAGWSGGGIYSFFSTQTNIFSSTISGNVTADVGGGLRLLGNATIVNSTFSGNVSNGWHGGAMFLTDGVSTMTNSTVAENVSPAGLADIFVGTFTDASVRLNLANSIITSGSGANCFLAYFGGGSVELISDGHNIAGDETCNLAATGDQPDTDPLLGPLADNGGPTQTHALLAGSPAIDNAAGVLCPATDQRGMTRPLGAGCDIGAYELDPAAATGLAAPAEHRNGLYLPLIVR
jgi:hypothetical protein